VHFLRDLYINNQFYLVLAGLVISYTLGNFYTTFSAISEVLIIVVGLFLLVDILLLFGANSGFSAKRITPQRLSNGDNNTIRLQVDSKYRIQTLVKIIDEIPIQFQIRNFEILTGFEKLQEQSFSYQLRPVNRGNYDFDNIMIYASTRLGFFQRRFEIEAKESVPVYPSFIQMRKFEMYAISNRLIDLGVKKIRRLGHTMEFDQIKEYVRGDDIRSINWKATARSNQLMVNQYQDERSQQIINVIDLGRVMKMPFDGLQLLEYALNTSLVISNISVIKDDKAGLLTFSNNEVRAVRPEKKRTHIRSIQHALYNVDTNFMESDFDRLLVGLKNHVKQRSLILLYTNFETVSSMERQLAYLKRIARDHLLVTIFFENTEVSELLDRESQNVGDIYLKTVAEKFNFEKRQIVKSLNREGIHTILTPPKELSINAINKYLELKARALI
jgi:uncharacterized protein (DUF58 family)